LFSRNY